MRIRFLIVLLALLTSISLAQDSSDKAASEKAAARNRELAAQIANTLVEIYLDQERQRLSGPASDRAKRYAAELAELKHKVNLAQDQVTAFRQRTGVTDAGAQNNPGLLAAVPDPPERAGARTWRTREAEAGPADAPELPEQFEDD